MACVGKVLALGYFDSVHLGHKLLIDRATHVLTFDDDFFSVRNLPYKQVFTLEERRIIIKKPLIVANSRQMMPMKPQEFIAYLKDIGVSRVIVGEDFHFGANATGGISDLISAGFSVEVVPFLQKDRQKVASSLIKDLLTAGRIIEANRLMTHDYFILGTVLHGRGDGSKLTFPTANIAIPPAKLAPKAGVYRSFTQIDGKKYLSITSLGPQPTFGSDAFRAETHVLDYHDDLYGKEIRVYLYEYLREIRKFEDKTALMKQIEEDISRVKR